MKTNTIFTTVLQLITLGCIIFLSVQLFELKKENQVLQKENTELKGHTSVYVVTKDGVYKCRNMERFREHFSRGIFQLD